VYRRILVPLDGSDRAERALKHASELAHGRSGHLLLLHVVEPPVIAGPVVAAGAPGTTASPQLITLDDAMTRAQEEAQRYLEGKKSELDAESVSCEILLEQGGVVQKIAEAAEKSEVDLVVMTSHGRSGLAAAFFGSVAIGVLHRLEKPILLIRADRDAEE